MQDPGVRPLHAQTCRNQVSHPTLSFIWLILYWWDFGPFLPPFVSPKVGRWPCFSPGSDAAFSEMFGYWWSIWLCWHAFTCWKTHSLLLTMLFLFVLHVHDPKILPSSHSGWKTSSCFIFLWIFCSHSCYCKHPLSSLREREGKKIKTKTKCWWKHLKMSNPSWYGVKQSLIMMFEPFSV